MKNRLFTLFVFTLLSTSIFADDQYFYCGFSNLDGSEQDYARWSKGKDFKFSNQNNRWERNSKYSFEYIYPDGRYEQIANVSYFNNKRGQCNSKMEIIYKQRIADIIKKHDK